MKFRFITHRLVLLPLALLLAACATDREPPRSSDIDINTGPFGPRVRIGGIDQDDSTPVSVRIGR